jgi:hypothetical protein
VIGVKTARRAATERLKGGRPSRTKSSVTAVVTGGAVAAAVYKTLRNA